MRRLTAVVLTALLMSAGGRAQEVRVATVNTWTGLTYDGTWSISSFEDEASREARFDALVGGLRAEHPDIIALQELNPVGGRSRTLGDALNYDVISQRVLGGVKIGSIGLPWNLNEGLAILSRPELQLEFLDVIPLSTDVGAFGDVLSFHFNEQNAALVGAIWLSADRRVIIVNLHLPSSPEDTPDMRDRLTEICRQRSLPDPEIGLWLTILSEIDRKRSAMITRLLDELETRYPGEPLILMGDFNLPDRSPDIIRIGQAHGYTPVRPLATWDGGTNPLTRYSSAMTSDSNSLDPIEQLMHSVDGEERSLDHIFVRSPFTADAVTGVRTILDVPIAGTFATDHYGLMATLDMTHIRPVEDADRTSFEVLPILSYDNDVGFGYGVKAFLLDELSYRESVDLIAFNSSKGERWYRLVVSVPDFELRQGSEYPLSLDVTVDYDRYLKNAFFGIGPQAVASAREEYTKEVFDVQALLSRGLTRKTVVQGGVRYRRISDANFGPTSAIPLLSSPLSADVATAVSLQASFRHDTRNSYINPSRGLVLGGDAEYAPPVGNTGFTQVGASIQYYTTLMYPKTVLALRLAAQTIGGGDIPLQFLLPLGGNKTVRGYPENRFMGRMTIISNAELRFPLVWRFGAILGYDTGGIWSSPSEVQLSAWKSSTAVGLRFYMDTFIVRADLGFSTETTGFYLNFGHIF